MRRGASILRPTWRRPITAISGLLANYRCFRQFSYSLLVGFLVSILECKNVVVTVRPYQPRPRSYFSSLYVCVWHCYMCRSLFHHRQDQFATIKLLSPLYSSGHARGLQTHLARSLKQCTWLSGVSMPLSKLFKWYLNILGEFPILFQYTSHDEKIPFELEKNPCVTENWCTIQTEKAVTYLRCVARSS